MPDSSPIRRWWRRFPARLSVRASMVVVLAVAIGLGWVVHRARRQRDAVTAILRIGGSVQYDWQFRDGRMVSNGEPGGPRWLARLAGPDLFDTVTNASITRRVTDSEMAAIGNLDRVDTMTLDPRGLSEEGLAHLDRMSGLRWLTITGGKVGMDTRIMPRRFLGRLSGLNFGRTDITDAGLRYLPGKDQLELIDLSDTKITDAGLAHLEGLTNLKHLDLDGTTIGDEDLARLARLRNLETLSLNGTKVTAEGVKAFRGASPNVAIRRLLLNPQGGR